MIDKNTNSRSNNIFVIWLVLIVLGIFLLFSQKRHIGFEPGHHGWVSAHSLAQIVKSTPENYFVGYTLSFYSPSNIPWHKNYYFDRYPFPFSASFNSLLSLLDGRLGDTIHHARQLMNLIFWVMLVLTYLLLVQISNNHFASLSAALSVFSGHYLLFYKDMIHYDQPAIAGMLLLINTIMYYYRSGKQWPVLVASVICVLMGRGYVSCAILIFWLVCLFVNDFIVEYFYLKRTINPLFKKTAIIATLAAVLTSSIFLSYNIFIESHVRQVSVENTSIVKSALKRLGMNQDFNEKHKENLNWRNVLNIHSTRLTESLFPAQLKDNVVNLTPLVKHTVTLVLFLLILLFLFRLPNKIFMPYIVAVFGVFLWTMPMRNLTVFHDYTTMYYCGFLGIAFLALYTLIPSRVLIWFCFPIVLVSFGNAVKHVSDLHTGLSNDRSRITEDFEVIIEQLPNIASLYVDGGYRNLLSGVPYSMGYYGKDYMLAYRESVAAFIISKDADRNEENLTPNNSIVFLYRNQHL